MDDIICQEMRPDDLPAVAAIEEATFSQPWSLKGFRDALAQPDTLFLIAKTEDEIAGYCGYYRSFDEAEIVNFAVREDLRGKGVGGVMLGELLRRGEADGIGRFILEVRRSNTPAIRLYEKNGFETAGFRRHFYEQPREDAAIMIRTS